jgi:hypothetical protein
MFTAMPRMLPSASTPPPSSTPPVWTPTRTSKAVVPMRLRHFRAELLAEGEQGQAAAHGALGVVLAGFVGAEGGQDAVAGVLQHLAAVGLDDGGGARQGAVHHGADRFRVEVLGERGRADHVEEQDAHLPEALRRGAEAADDAASDASFARAAATAARPPRRRAPGAAPAAPRSRLRAAAAPSSADGSNGASPRRGQSMRAARAAPDQRTNWST